MKKENKDLKDECEVQSSNLLENCLYFTLNKFARKLNSVADESFKKTGLAPNYAFALVQISENPGISSSELAKSLSLSPSTITRFIDKLIIKGFCKREVDKKITILTLTEKGSDLLEDIKISWSELYKSYSDSLGELEGQKLTKQLNELADLL